MARLWVWTCAPGWMSSLANPMTWLYRCTGAPLAMARRVEALDVRARGFDELGERGGGERPRLCVHSLDLPGQVRQGVLGVVMIGHGFGSLPSHAPSGRRPPVVPGGQG